MLKKEAVLYAVIARDAYLNSANDPNYKITAKFSNAATDTQGFFGVAFGNTLVIGFRGSEETGTADWITDLKFIPFVYPFAPKTNPNISVHGGFIEAYTSVREAVLKAAKDTACQKVVCSGHSLGGALAALASMDIVLNVPGKQMSCYTFGSPKVGDAAFAAVYNKLVPETHRFVNDADIIPTIPPFGFEHVGQLHHLGANVADTSGITEMITEKVMDHLPNNYIDILNKYL
jgi:triacylglycerol lipase